MKKILWFLALLFFSGAPAAFAQNTRTGMTVYNNSTFTSNGSGAITGKAVNSWNAASIASLGFLSDTNTWTGTNNFTGAFLINGVPLSANTTIFTQTTYSTVTGLGAGANSNYMLDISSVCTVDSTGASDMGKCINDTLARAQAAVLAAGSVSSIAASGIVTMPCGTYMISTPVVPVSFIELDGGGEGCTIWNPTIPNAVATNQNQMVLFSGMKGISIRCSGVCNPSWNGLTFYSFQASNFSHLEISGFTGGFGLLVSPTNASPTQNYTYGNFGANGNVIHNHFDHLLIENVATGISLSGQIHAGSCADGSGGVGGAIDTTDNYFDNVDIIGAHYGVVTTHCNDSNHFDNVQFYGNTGATCLVLGNDGVNADHDNYQTYFHGLCSSQNATAMTLVYILSNGTSYGHHIKIESDDIFSFATGAGSYGACVNTANGTTVSFAELSLPSKCNANIPNDRTAFGYSATTGSILGGDNMWFQGSSAATTTPAFSFYGDPLTGMFHNGAGTVGLHGGGGSSGYIQLYNNGGTYNTLSCQTLGTNSNGQVMCSAPGAVPTNSGSCAINTQVGGSFAGSFKANGACSSGTLLFTFPISQANGYACTIQDMTTTADVVKQSGSATNQASFFGSMASGDTLVYQCAGF